ncbi:HK97 gp10 family phage protein [Alkaliphilus sp. MSJ-5]|uniref:HK97 gp10 family phage protein n=1 Tax=Alkaliphilus flagellatus TaxID=2841507 RepID=A0ABS6G8G9_9FIRM|nr:HK97-gp10 family putative phage morphogenesis protein [Alkaliphilus flagellatus]MBU5677908.1 HK97 gp10 family phage protein [Alkaliphilus flagellatus]
MSIEGFDSLMRKLDSLGGSTTKAVAKGVGLAAKKVQGDAKDLAPVDTGQLRNSISTNIEEKDNVIVGKVFTNNDHAAYVEFGTGQRGKASDIESKKEMNISYKEDWTGMAAQPFMYPAMKQNEGYIKDTIKGAIQMEIKKVSK